MRKISFEGFYPKIDSFGFLKGSNYSFTIHSTNPVSFILCYLNGEELAKVFSKDFSKINICDLTYHVSEINHSISFREHFLTINGSILRKEVYHIFLFNCLLRKTEIIVEYQMKNPLSLLDYRKIPAITIKKYTQIVLIIFLLISVVLLIYQKGGLSRFIYVYMFVSTGLLISNSFHINELKWQSISEENTKFTLFRMVSMFFTKVVLYTSLFLGSCGWGMCYSYVNYKTIISSLIAASLLYIFETGAQSSILENWIIVFILGFILSAIIITKTVLIYIDDTENHILAHLIAIYKTGIDPSTTPVYDRFVLYNRFQKTLSIYFLISFVLINIKIFGDLDFWIYEWVEDSNSIYILCMLLIRFNKITEIPNGYNDINDIPNEIMEEELKGLDINSELIQDHSLERWEYGTVLPSQPKIVSDQIFDVDEQII